MNRVVIALLVRLYPKSWRTRFGREFEDMLEVERIGPAAMLDIARSAVIERLFNPSGLGDLVVQTYPKNVVSLVQRPSGYLPIAMSACAMAVVLGFLAINGVVRQPDEGAAAHIFQLLVAGQFPIPAFFAIKWLPKDRIAALSVIAFQVLAVVVASLPVWMLGL